MPGSSPKKSSNPTADKSGSFTSDGSFPSQFDIQTLDDILKDLPDIAASKNDLSTPEISLNSSFSSAGSGRRPKLMSKRRFRERSKSQLSSSSSSCFSQGGPFRDEMEEGRRKEWDGRENSQEVELSRVQIRGEEETVKPASPCKKVVEELQSTKNKLELCVAKKKDQDSNSKEKIDENDFKPKERKDGDDRNKANQNKSDKARDTSKRKANKVNIYLAKKKRNDELGKKKNKSLPKEVEPSQDDFTSSEVSHMNKTKVGSIPVVFKSKDSSSPGSGPNTSLLPGSILGASPLPEEVLIWKNYKIPKQKKLTRRSTQKPIIKENQLSASVDSGILTQQQPMKLMQSSEETNNFPFLPCTVGLSPTKEATDDSATSIDDFTQDNLTPIPCNMTLREDENQSLHPTDNNHSRFQEQGDHKNSKKTKLKRKKKDKNLDLVLQDASKENPIREESNLEGDITVISDEEEENGGAEMRIVIDSVYSLAPNSPTADQWTNVMEPVVRQGFAEAESQDSASEQVPVEAPPVEDELEGLRFIPFNSGLKRPSGANIVNLKKRNRKRKYQKRGNALQEIKFYQNQSTNLLIPKLTYQRLVKEIVLQYNPEFRIQSAALEALQEAGESFLVGVLENANLAAIHAKRVTLQLQDLRLAKKIQCI